MRERNATASTFQERQLNYISQPQDNLFPGKGQLAVTSQLSSLNERRTKQRGLATVAIPIAVLGACVNCWEPGRGIQMLRGAYANIRAPRALDKHEEGNEACGLTVTSNHILLLS